MLKVEQLKAQLRLAEIPRWGIVPMIRQQTVGEHSYRVFILAMDLWDTIHPVSHNSDGRNLVAQVALTHDLDEVITGDMPSTMKRAIRAEAPGLLERITQKAMQDIAPSAIPLKRAIQGTLAEAVLTLADMVEALLYCRTWGAHDDYTQEVILEIDHRIQAHVDDTVKNYAPLSPSMVPAIEGWLDRLNIQVEIPDDPED